MKRGNKFPLCSSRHSQPNKRGLIVFAGLFLLLGSVLLISAANDNILKISSNTNAHGEVYNQNIYSVSINYSDVFGVNYIGTEAEAHPTCNDANMIVELSSATNAHAQRTGDYNNGVCYGDMTCTIRSQECTGDEKCVVTLSSSTSPDFTNSHLAKCDSQESYPTKVCCVRPQANNDTFCEQQDNKTKCWENPRNIACSWTPLLNDTTGKLTTSKLDGGHCCGEGEEWDYFKRKCYSYSQGPTCNNPWSIDNQDGEGTRLLNKTTGKFDKYCGQISKFGGTLGLWYDVQTY